MKKIEKNTYYQIAYDFKVFIRESLLYNYDLELLQKFAKYMDNIFFLIINYIINLFLFLILILMI